MDLLRESEKSRESNAGRRDEGGEDRIEGGIPRAFGKAHLGAKLIMSLRAGYLQVPGCVRLTAEKHDANEKHRTLSELRN